MTDTTIVYMAELDGRRQVVKGGGKLTRQVARLTNGKTRVEWVWQPPREPPADYIKPGSNVMLRNGSKAHIKYVDRDFDQPVIGYVEGDMELRQWGIGGHFFAGVEYTCSMDIVAPWKEMKP